MPSHHDAKSKHINLRLFYLLSESEAISFLPPNRIWHCNKQILRNFKNVLLRYINSVFWTISIHETKSYQKRKQHKIGHCKIQTVSKKCSRTSYYTNGLLLQFKYIIASQSNTPAGPSLNWKVSGNYYFWVLNVYPQNQTWLLPRSVLKLQNNSIKYFTGLLLRHSFASQVLPN